MKENRTPNYGLDAPVAVRNMLIVAAVGIISLITRLLGVGSVGWGYGIGSKVIGSKS